MRSNYKRLGNYIQSIEGRNVELKEIPLMGLSINKVFIPSIANTIGTNMATYRIIKKNQFAYCPVTSRNGEKITIALFDNYYDEALLSQAYIPFEVTDSRNLMPEYLMMWFRRPEFDRYARFMSHGSAREVFSWDDLCNVSLPIPSIEKQREIVKEYNIIQNRIKLNEQLIQKLEETAQAIYKQWFVEKENIKLITIKEFCMEMKSGGTPSRTEISYWDKKDIPWIKTGEIKNNVVIKSEEFISREGLKNSSAKILPKDTVLISMYGVNAGEIGILKFVAATNQACCGMICKNSMLSAFLYYHLLHYQKYIASQAVGGAQENLNKEFVEKFEIPVAENKIALSLKYIIDNKENYTRQKLKLEITKELLLSKLATTGD